MQDLDSSSTTTPSSGVFFDPFQASPNASLTIADHLLVSKEAQAIIGGVVGFWGGVFGMGSVYLLVVFLRRLRKHLNDHRKNTPTVPRPEKRKIFGGNSAIFGGGNTRNEINLMNLHPTSQAHAPSSVGTSHTADHGTSSVPDHATSLSAVVAAGSGATSAATSGHVTGHSHREHHQQRMPKQQTKFPLKSSSHNFGLGSGSSGGGGFGGTSGGTRLKFSGFGLGAALNRDDSGMADCQL